MNKRTVALTTEQYKKIIKTMMSGFVDEDQNIVKPNRRIATALTLEANLGLRIGDILKLRLSDIIRDGDRYRLDIIEEKSGKKREFTVPLEIYAYIQNYALENNIRTTAKLFEISERAVNKHLQKVCKYLNLDGIGSHSFRKFFATTIYNNNRHNINLVRVLLQHSSIATTQRYIGMRCKNGNGNGSKFFNRKTMQQDHLGTVG